MIKITFNPLQLIKLILLIMLFGTMLTLDISLFWTFGINKEQTYNLLLVDKTGSGSSRNFEMLDEESGKTINVYPTEDWFDSSREGQHYNISLSLSRFNGWLVLWQLMAWLSMIISAIWFLIWSISWIAENIHKLDRDVDIYVGEQSWKNPIQFKRVVVHELPKR